MQFPGFLMSFRAWQTSWSDKIVKFIKKYCLFVNLEMRINVSSNG